MTDTTPKVGDRRPGGRAERVRASVLAATSELLDDAGYDGLTIDEVAQRAGVHKTTVYRRWPSKAELVVAALEVDGEAAIPVPDTGTFLGDLTALAGFVAANLSSDRGARRSRSLVASGAESEELASSMHAYWRTRLAVTGPVVTRAIERGEVAGHVDPNVVIETLVGPIWLRFLMTGEPIDEPFAAQVAAIVAAGVARP